MAEPIKPKRGFVAPHFYKYDRAFMVWPDRDDLTPTPVLVIPEPDRDPTPQEIEALAEALYATTAPGAIDGPFAAMMREVARAAWRLGARVPS